LRVARGNGAQARVPVPLEARMSSTSDWCERRRTLACGSRALAIELRRYGGAGQPEGGAVN